MNDLTPASFSDYQAGPPIDLESGPAPKFRKQKFLAFLRKFWWLPLVTLALSLAAALVYVRFQPPTYVSTASMWEPVQLRLPEGTVFSEDIANFLGTQTELLQSSRLRDLALDRLRAANVAVPSGADGEALPVKIRVVQTSKSSVFSLIATGPQQEFTRAYLGALIDAYLQYKQDMLKVVSGITLNSITLQETAAEQDRNRRQQALTDYESSNNLAILQVKGTAAGQYLTKLKTELSDLQLQEQLLKTTATNPDVSVPAANTTNSSLPDAAGLAGVPDPGAGGGVPADQQNAIKELDLLEMQRAELTNLLPTHPRIVKLDADIEHAREVLDIYRRQGLDRLTNSLATTRLRIENVQASIKQWETNVIEYSARIADADRIRIDLQRAQADYERLAALLENVTISRNIDQETLTVLQSATPSVRSYTSEKSTLGLAGTGGLVLGLALIAWITVRDEKFSSVGEVNQELGDAVIAQVPEVTGLNGKHPLQLEDAGKMHMYAESYRCLRSALMYSGFEGGPPRVLLITSALPDEGKSTVAVNLARSLAQGGARVLLVDADLRRGRLHEFFGLQQEPGLGHLLHHPGEAEKVLQTNSVRNLWLIPCGSRVSNPGDLFLGAALEDLLKRWKSQFDYVLIDSSPIFAADDATSLAPKVDATLLVVRSRYSNARQVRESLEMLHQRQARVLGVVFNRADAAARSYNYYKYAKYYPTPDALPVKNG